VFLISTEDADGRLSELLTRPVTCSFTTHTHTYVVKASPDLAGDPPKKPS